MHTLGAKAIETALNAHKKGDQGLSRTTNAAGERRGALWCGGHTLGTTAEGRGNRDAWGRTVASVRGDATGVGIQGARGAQADGRRVGVGKVFNPRTEPSEAFLQPAPGLGPLPGRAEGP